MTWNWSKQEIQRGARVLLKDLEAADAFARKIVEVGVTPQEFEEMLLRWARSNRNLEVTKTFVEIWAAVLEHKKPMKYAEELEEIIRDRAKDEMGTDTLVYFNRDRGIAAVMNPKTLNQVIIADYAFTKQDAKIEMPDGPGAA